MKQASPPRRLASFTITSGVVSAFLLVTSLIGFVDEKGGPLGAGWSLRGTLVPSAEASAAHVGATPAARLARPALHGPKNPV